MVKKKGFTLIEIVVVLAIMGIVFLVVSNVFSLVINTNKIANNEFDLQSNMRIVSENLNQKIRFSPAVFTLKKETFEKPKKSGWRYLGIEDVKDKSGNIIGKQVVEYIPVIEEEKEIVDGETVITYKSTGTSADHNRKVLINNINDVDINLYFDKNMSDKNSKLLDFVIEGVTKDSLRRKMTISTKLQALNAMVVEHEGNPAVAIAYKDEVPGKRVKGTQEAYAIITLTLDLSGSMRFDMDGEEYGINDERINALNEKTNKLIADLKSDGGKIYINIITYGTRVDEYDTLSNFKNINDIEYKNFKAKWGYDGGTNTGEALLKAYQSMLEKPGVTIPPGAKVNYYNILLTDGEPTHYTRYIIEGDKHGPYSGYGPQDMNNMYHSEKIKRWFSYHHTDYYFFRDKWTSPLYISDNNYGYNGKPNTSYAMQYVKRIAKDYISKSPLEIKSYIIGFGNEKNDYGQNINENLSKEIASYCVGEDSMVFDPKNKNGKSAYYNATSSEQLDIVYSELTEIIKGDMWHVMGPYDN